MIRFRTRLFQLYTLTPRIGQHLHTDHLSVKWLSIGMQLPHSDHSVWPHLIAPRTSQHSRLLQPLAHHVQPTRLGYSKTLLRVDCGWYTAILIGSNWSKWPWLTGPFRLTVFVTHCLNKSVTTKHHGINFRNKKSVCKREILLVQIGPNTLDWLILQDRFFFTYRCRRTLRTLQLTKSNWKRAYEYIRGI